jgi:hypothetical protein
LEFEVVRQVGEAIIRPDAAGEGIALPGLVIAPSDAELPRAVYLANTPNG